MKVENIISSITIRNMSIIITLIIGVIYGRTVTYDFVLDDAIVITENAYTSLDIQGLWDILTHDSFHGFFQDDEKTRLVQGGRYRPLSIMSFAVENTIALGNPFIGHFLNVLWYAFNCFLVFLLTKRMARNTLPNVAHQIAVIAALFFTVHPLHVEVVANIKGRDELMAFTFGLLALYLFFGQMKSFKVIRAVLLFIISFSAAMSKENALFLLSLTPFIGMLLFNRKDYVSIWKYSIPIFLALLVYMIIRVSIIGITIGAPSQELMNNPFLEYRGNELVPMPFLTKWGTVIQGLAMYFKLIFIPYPLTHDYYPRHLDVVSLLSLRSILHLFLYIGLGVFSWKLRKQSPLISIGIGIFLWCLIPVSNIFFSVGTHVSERFLYISSYGAILALVTCSISLIPQKYLRYTWAIGTIVFILFFFISMMRVPAWKDNESLFLTDIQYSPNSAKMQNAVGGLFTDKGLASTNDSLANEYFHQAVPHLERAIEIHPLYKSAYFIKGIAQERLKEYDEAIESYENALKLDPNDQEIKVNYTYTLRQAARYNGEVKGNINQSLALLQKAMNIDPYNAETIRLLGIANGVAGDYLKAIKFLKKAIELSQPTAQIYKNIAVSYYKLNQKDSADYYFEAASRMDSNIQIN